MLDIPEEKVRAVDPEDMLGRVSAYPDMLQAALDSMSGFSASLPRKPTRILVVGMGGSAITGDYLAAWLDAEGGVPMLVSRAYELPHWVDKDTLVLGFSYSGKTEETLSSFAQAHKKGAMLAAVSTGDRMEELAKNYHAPFARLQPGMQPRAALPNVMGTASMLLDRLGLLKAEAALKKTVTTLRESVVDIAPDVPASKNEAKRTALAMQDTVPAVYAAGLLAPAARRFANQINENSKVVALWGVMPEMNHNELVGWAGDEDLDRFTAVFLRYADEHDQAKQRFEFTGRLIQERGGRLVQMEARGATIPEKLLTVSLAGDAVSVYLAALRGIDPTPVKIITELKNKMGETGFAAGIK